MLLPIYNNVWDENCMFAIPIYNFELVPQVYIPAISLQSETMAIISPFLMKSKKHENFGCV